MELCENEHVYWGTKNISGIEKIATANICSIPFITRNNLFRSNLLGSAINQLSPQLATFQEAYDTGSIRNLRQSLPQYQFALSGSEDIFNRGGLVTISRKPILRSFYIPFKKQGAVFSRRTLLSPQLSDRFAGKGYLVIETESVIVINVHFTALYLKSKSLETLKALDTQRSQLFELIEFVQKLSGKLVILMGDLNFSPNTDLYMETTKYFLDLTHSIPETWYSGRNQHRLASTQFTGILQDKLDYILVSHSKGLQFIKNMFEKIKVSLFNDETGVLSDHKMVLATKH